MSHPLSRQVQRRTGRRWRKLAGVAAAVVAVAALGGGHASAKTSHGSATTALRAGPICWKEYDFSRSGNVLIATAVKDCTHLDVAQPLPVRIEMWYSDPYYSGWLTVASGTGAATTPPGYCDPSWPAVYRHSVTREEIRCP